MNTPVKNAIILAAGTSSRFVPLSYERPKGLIEVKGEILIERQIRQLHEAGVNDITVVTGYMADSFKYLIDKYRVSTVFNEDFARYNNTSSLIRVLDRLQNTFVCSSDNYFPSNVFLNSPDHSFYSALFAQGTTSEYCIETDTADRITGVTIGGHNAWYMVGHVYFNREFSSRFSDILKSEYVDPETPQQYWEDVYIRNINRLPAMKIRRYADGEILEFDSLDELRKFDCSYLDNSRSAFIREIASGLGCRESELSGFKKQPTSDGENVFSFVKGSKTYLYNIKNKSLESL